VADGAVPHLFIQRVAGGSGLQNVRALAGFGRSLGQRVAGDGLGAALAAMFG
jgi:hypothetical protein